MSPYTLFSDPYALDPGRCAQIWTVDLDTGATTLLHESFDIHLEAPNWSLDGERLILSGNGRFWTIAVEGGELTEIPLNALPPVTNDHVLDPDGETLLVTALDGQIYRVPIAGGDVTPVTADQKVSHFLHGISPDRSTLAYVELPFGDFAAAARLVLTDADGGNRRMLPTGHGHCDGPEFTPDGQWIVLNTEAFTDAPGHAQIARINVDGSGFERLVDSHRVDWFPHVAPTADRAAYLSYPPGTLGHPADLPVLIKIVDPADWTRPIAEIEVFGGQGTLNVNSWSPSGRKLAFIAFPIDQELTPALSFSHR